MIALTFAPCGEGAADGAVNVDWLGVAVRLPAEEKEVLNVLLRGKARRVGEAQRGEVEALGLANNALKHLVVVGRGVGEAATTYLGGPHLKLGFHQQHRPTMVVEKAGERGDDEGEGDERNVAHDGINRGAIKVGKLKGADVQPLEGGDPRVGA